MEVREYVRLLRRRWYFLALGAVGLWAIGHSRHRGRHVHVHTHLEVVEPSDAYPLQRCVISGKSLHGRETRVAIMYQGQEVQFCCETCIPTFEADPEKYLEEMREAQK